MSYSPSAGADLTAGGADGIQVTVDFADQPFTLAINATGGGGTAGSSQLVGVTSASSDVQFAFTDFTGVDFSNVTTLELVATPTLPGTELAFGVVGTVAIPEPSVSILALGALGLLMRRRR